MPLTLQRRFTDTIDRLLGPATELGVAVSGGSDSTALLHLCAAWGREKSRRILAISVDHGLRAEAGLEVDQVAGQCAELGIVHCRVKWQGWEGGGNLQAMARQARYSLIAQWAATHGLGHVALGHTLDDQAETVLARLARGSGVDGLSGMAEKRNADGVSWLRPLLGFRREELRRYLTRHEISWSDDPSNEDQRFDRVRIRKALEILRPLGIDETGLSETAMRLRAARAALERATWDAAKHIAEIRAGSVFLDSEGLSDLPDEIRRRLLDHALRWVTGTAYGPRHQSLAAAERSIRAKKRTTLHGCLISPWQEKCVIAREYSAISDRVAEPGQLWDGRWRMTGRAQDRMVLRALGGNGLKSCKNWRDIGLPRDTLLASPAVWRGDELVSAPLAGVANGWRAELIHPENHFISSILSH